MTQSKKAEKEAEEVTEEAIETEEYAPPTGPTQTPVEEHAGAVAAQTVAPAGEPQPNPNTIDDGVEDIELGPPAVGQWVQITAGEYAGRFAAYLGNVSMQADDDPTVPAVIQVRTRDADNLVLDVPYADVTATTYSGGR